MRVQQWMTPDPVTVTGDLDAQAALEEMIKRKVRRFPVLTEGKLAGIVTRNDLQAALGTLRGVKIHADVTRRTVAEIMTPAPTTIRPDASLDEAAALLYKQRISGLPVMAGTDLVGIITETDLFRAFVIVFGLVDAGGVVEFELDKADHLMQQVQQRAGGMVVRNLIAYQDPRTGRMEVRMKVRGREGSAGKHGEA